MPTRKVAIVALALAGTAGLMVLGTWPSPAPVDVKVTKAEPAQVFDDAGKEMVLVMLTFSMPAEGSWICVQSGAEVEAKLSGQWITLDQTVSPGSLGSGETREELLLVPGSADRCRIHLRYAGASIPWRFGGWLARRGIRLPPSYWGWAGWPRAEGRNPRWNNSNVELALVPNSGRGSNSQRSRSPHTRTKKTKHSRQAGDKSWICDPCKLRHRRLRSPPFLVI